MAMPPKEQFTARPCPPHDAATKPVSRPRTVSVRVKALQDAFHRNQDSPRPPTSPPPSLPFRLTPNQTSLSSTKQNKNPVKLSLPSLPPATSVTNSVTKPLERSKLNRGTEGTPSQSDVACPTPKMAPSTHTSEKIPTANPQESPGTAPFALTRKNSLAVFVKGDCFTGPQIAVLPKENSPSNIPRALTRQNTKVAFVEKGYFTGPQIVVLPKENSPNSETPIFEEKRVVRNPQFADSKLRKAVHHVPKPRRIPFESMIEQLDEMIDECSEENDNCKAEQLAESPRVEGNSAPEVPEPARFLQDQSRYMESPAIMDPSAGKDYQYYTSDHISGYKDSIASTHSLKGSQRKHCTQRSVTIGPLRSSSECEPYVIGHLAIDKLKSPRDYPRTQIDHPHRKSTRLDSTGTAKLYESHSSPGPIRAPLKKTRIDHGSFNIYIGHQQDHSIITSPDHNNDGEKEQRPIHELRQATQSHLGSRRSNGSIKSNASTRSWMPSLKWRWWKLVLVDIETPSHPSSKADSAPTDKGDIGGDTNTTTLHNQDDNYDSEKELAKEILSVLAHHREGSNDASIFAEEIRASRCAYTRAQSEEEHGEGKEENVASIMSQEMS